MTQKFKGDPVELQMEAAGAPAFDITSAALDQFYEGAYDSTNWIIALYDNGRMPFSERVPRDSFVEFYKNALPSFPKTGTFETYILILTAVFGFGSGIQFTVPGPGKLEILVNAANTIPYGFIFQEFIDGEYVISGCVDHDGSHIQFSGISGIDSEAELKQLLSELIPAGVYTEVTLDFFNLFRFIAEDSGTEYSIVDSDNNQIVFIET